MSDEGISSFTEVTQKSWLGQLGGSLLAAVIGLVMFVASIPLLYWNEGRAVAEITSLNAGARTVVSVPAAAVDPAHQNALVHVTGDAAVSRPAQDPLFHVMPPDAMRLMRTVDTYHWEEEKTSTTDKQVGGGETTRTTYTYKKVWSSAAVDSSKFKQPEGHANPAPAVKSATFDAGAVSIGAFRLDPALLDSLSGYKAMPAPAPAPGADPSFHQVGEVLYRGSSIDTPAIGDQKVSFGVIAAQPVSIVAAQIGQTLAPYRGADGRTIALADLGTRSADDMFAEAKSASNIFTWIMRVVGFFVMLIGIALLSAPLGWLVSILPFLSGILDAAAIAVAFIVAVPLTLFVIAVAWVAHRPLIGLGLIAAGLVLGFGFRMLAPYRRRPAAVA